MIRDWIVGDPSPITIMQFLSLDLKPLGLPMFQVTVSLVLHYLLLTRTFFIRPLPLADSGEITRFLFHSLHFHFHAPRSKITAAAILQHTYSNRRSGRNHLNDCSVSIHQTSDKLSTFLYDHGYLHQSTRTDARKQAAPEHPKHQAEL